MKEKILENQKNNHTMNYMDNSKGMGMSMRNMGIGMNMGNMGIGMNMGNLGIGMNMGNMGTGMYMGYEYDSFRFGYAPLPNWNIMMNQQMNMGMMNSSPPMNMGMISSPPNKSIYMSNNNNLNNASITPQLSNDDYKMKDIQEKKNRNKKDDIMKIINTQDFINGFWEVNEYTNIIKEKYKEEFQRIKNKFKNIKDRAAITSLVIYFIEKEHPELLDELLMIIKKAKKFIFNEAKETYENIIKEISIS